MSHTGAVAGGHDAGPAEVLTPAQAMGVCLTAAAAARGQTSPNPWVGAAVLSAEGILVATGATEPPGGRHAEIVALEAAGGQADGATLVATLEPCSHHGRTPPCVDAIIAAGIARVIFGISDPDQQVDGAGMLRLEQAGIEVIEGVLADDAERQLEAYLWHRRTGRPLVIAKVAASLDGATAAPDGSSQWITGEAARRDGHRLRAESDAILVGAGTVRADDPSLTVRHVEGADPLRVILGSAPPAARVHPCLEWDGSLTDLLDELGERGVLQILIEGGSTVLRSFHDAELINRFVVYLAPIFFLGGDGLPSIGGPTVASIQDVWRGRFLSCDSVGDDIRVELAPETQPSPHTS